MTSQEKIKWLSRCKDIDRKIQSKCDEVSVWMSRATKITSTISDMPKGGQQENKTETTVEKIMQIDAEINREIDELVKIKAEVRSAISAVPNSTYREVLERRYIRGQKWEQIAVEMAYEYHYVCRLHGKALEMLDIEKRINKDTT